MSEPRDDVGDVDAVQWVVVCLDVEDAAPHVYAAWDTESEAATWLDEEHLEPIDDDVPDMCENGSSEYDHYVVTAIDCT